MLTVYLDTSFLSQFANVEMGKPGVPSAEKWVSLLACLRQQVERGLLICPASQFQLQEAQLRPDLLRHFRRIQSELSKGYFLKDYQVILVHQTANQVLIYLKRPQNINLGWSALTREEPPVIPAEYTRDAKQYVKQHAEQLGPSKMSFSDQYQRERDQFLHMATFLQPIRRVLRFPVAREGLDSSFAMLVREANISWDEVPRVLEFFFSSGLREQIPFVQIYCSIIASLRVDEPTREPQDGDWLDAAILASTIPYCDIVTTDKNMKTRIVDRRKLDVKYGTRIFSATPKDLGNLAELLPTVS